MINLLDYVNTKFKQVISYADAWKVIILLLVSDHVKNTDIGESILTKFSKFRALQNAIDEYYRSASLLK